MSKNRRGGRDLHSHRPIDITVGFHRLAEGSVLYRAEGTVILVTASVEEGVPRFLEGSGKGWLTAEYQIHPRANPQRRNPGGRKLSGGRPAHYARSGSGCRRAGNRHRNGESGKTRAGITL